MRVNLVDIVYGLESQSEDHLFYVNRHSGEIIHVVHKFLHMAKFDEVQKQMEKWEVEEFRLAKKILRDSNDYILLPQMPAIQKVMIRFTETVEDIERQKALLETIQASATFKPFRSLLKMYDLLDDWYGFREEIYIGIARDFCEKHELNYQLIE